MSKHTPGPWFAGEITGLVEDRRSLLRGPDGKHVGFFMPSFTSMGLRQDEANARLIGAAPELLALLCEASRWIDSYELGTGEELGNRIKAAIAKAQGQ